MSGPDRPEPIDPEAWPDDDPEATRIVRRDPPESPAEAMGPVDQQRQADTPHGESPPAPTGGDDSDVVPAAEESGAAANLGAPNDAGPTSVMPPYEPGPDPSEAATTYFGAPTASYPPPGTTGPQTYPPQAGYSYQQPQAAGMPYPGSAPPTIPPPSTTNVVLPPVRMPKAESRMALNLLGAIVGLLLVAGGLALTLLNQGQIHTIDTADLGALASGTATGGGAIDALSLALTIVGVVLIAVAALISAWASWAPILPGLLLSAASVWAMVTTGADGGAALIAKGTRWAFAHGEFALFCMSGLGLLVGLMLLAAGLAAVFLRAGVRRTIRQQLESIQF